MHAGGGAFFLSRCHAVTLPRDTEKKKPAARHAINIGLPIIECEQAAIAIKAGDEVEVDFDSGVITDKTTGEKFQGQAFPPFMQKIIACEGLVNYINQK